MSVQIYAVLHERRHSAATRRADAHTSIVDQDIETLVCGRDFVGQTPHVIERREIGANVNGQLAAGGRLFMLKAKQRANLYLGGEYVHGTTFDVDWVPIARPDNP